jgi:hypothetical protein
MTKQKFIPTPEEIRAMCEEIRKGWDQRRLNQQERRPDWDTPVHEDPSRKTGG